MTSRVYSPRSLPPPFGFFARFRRGIPFLEAPPASLVDSNKSMYSGVNPDQSKPEGEDPFWWAKPLEDKIPNREKLLVDQTPGLKRKVRRVITLFQALRRHFVRAPQHRFFPTKRQAAQQRRSEVTFEGRHRVCLVWVSGVAFVSF